MVFKFCPFCGNLLFVQKVVDECKFVCRLCPVSFPIKDKICIRTYCKGKDVDDVLAIEDTWRNCAVTTQTCPKCSHMKAYFIQTQTRSADEPMTIFYRCCNPECKNTWRSD